MKHILIAFLLLGIAGFAAALTSQGAEFQTKVRQTQSAEEALPIIQQYRDKLTDLEDLRVLQNYWMESDRPGCLAYFTAKHEAEPDKPEYHYLMLRVYDNPLRQYLGSRELLDKAPQFYWAYRIFCTSFSQLHVDPQITDEARAALLQNREHDLHLLQRGSAQFPADEYLNIAFYHYYRDLNDAPRAESYLLRLQDPQAIETNYELIMDFVKSSKRVKAFEVLFPKMLSNAIANGDIPATDSLSIFQYNYIDTLYKIADWDRLFAYFETNPDLKTMDDTLPTRIEMLIGRGDYETALNLLEGAMAKDIVTYPEALETESYLPLRDLPRYDEVMRQAAANWEASLAQRRSAAIARRVSKPAPLWSLPDKTGKLVNLEDLRGQIVILDFWATWCNPCLKTMPVLDAWYRKNNAKDLNVFSINVWDKSTPPSEIIGFMESGGYSMTLLLGNDELPKAYGFDGIPYICVIDKQGKIAYEHSGYSKDLPELLNFWVEDLRK